MQQRTIVEISVDGNTLVTRQKKRTLVSGSAKERRQNKRAALRGKLLEEWVRVSRVIVRPGQNLPQEIPGLDFHNDPDELIEKQAAENERIASLYAARAAALVNLNACNNRDVVLPKPRRARIVWEDAE